MTETLPPAGGSITGDRVIQIHLTTRLSENYHGMDGSSPDDRRPRQANRSACLRRAAAWRRLTPRVGTASRTIARIRMPED